MWLIGSTVYSSKQVSFLKLSTNFFTYFFPSIYEVRLFKTLNNYLIILHLHTRRQIKTVFVKTLNVDIFRKLLFDMLNWPKTKKNIQ